MKLLTVVGGQFGSEAKGHVAEKLAKREVEQSRQVIAVRVAGPNAGHTAYDKYGEAFALRTIPAMAVVDESVKLVLAAGSEIQEEVLADEIKLLEDAGHPIRDRLYIDSQATVLTEDHIKAEKGMHERMGSTGKGIGAARADRIMRTAEIVEDDVERWNKYGIVMDTGAQLRAHYYDGGTTVIVEGTQGYGLGLHAGHYPQCTSSNTRAIDFNAMAGIDPSHMGVSLYEPWVVFRTYPIRVAGNSGDLQGEIDFETLSARLGKEIEPERTTVTKKVRRIGEWDPYLFHQAIEANGGLPRVRIALTFADYIDPEIADTEALTQKVVEWIRDNIYKRCGHSPSLVTTGPNTCFWSAGLDV